MALGLTLVAVAVPCIAWFVAGSREIDRQTHLEVESVYNQATQQGVVLAERLATRLDMLRQMESHRPFYHYQNLFHDPQGAAEGDSVTLSPLAQGAVDPLIDVHFQFDESGRLTLPTLNDEFPELGRDDGRYCELYSELSEITAFAVFGDTGASLAMQGSLGRTMDPRDNLALLDGALLDGRVADANGGTRDGTPSVQVLEAKAWRQHLEANVLYRDLKYGNRRGERNRDRGGYAGVAQRVEIVTGPLAWYTIPVRGGRSRLVALRGVETPLGLWLQGFMVSEGLIDQYLESAIYPASIHSAAGLAEKTSTDSGAFGDTERVTLEIDGTPWNLVLDVSEAVTEASLRTESERERFWQVFLLGALAAALAGSTVVFMVHKSEHLAQQRAQFAASAAHELRTPLAGLRLYGEMLSEGLGDPSRAQHYARRVAGEAERLGRVVTNVLSFTHLERGSLALNCQVGNLAQAVRDACERQRPVLEENGAALELNLGSTADGGDLPTARFDRDAVGHIIQNLLDNAEKYTRGVEGRRIQVTLEPGEEHLVLTVADNGPGVPRPLRKGLFEPFTRGNHPDSPEGLGLGLVLVRALAEAQDGTIRYSDAPGGGAVFTVTVPRS